MSATTCNKSLRLRRFVRRAANSDRKGSHFSGQAAVICLMLVVIALAPLATAAAGIDFSRFGYRTDMLYVEGDRRQCQLGDFFSETRFSSKYFGFRGEVDLEYVVPTGRMSFGYYGAPEADLSNDIGSDGGRLSGRLNLRRTYLQTRLALSTPANLVSTALEFRASDEERPDITVSVSLQPARFFRLTLSRSKFQPLPAAVDYRFEPASQDHVVGQELGTIEFQSPARAEKLEVVLTPGRSIKLSYSSQAGRFEPQRPVYGEVSMQTYTSHLYGRWSESHFKATGPIPHVGIAGLAYRRLDLDLDSLTAIAGGLKFAHFGLLKGRGYDWRIEIQRGNWRTNCSWGNVSGRVAGVIQAWPFLDGLYGFLGERRHLIVEGELSWLHLTSSTKLHANRWFDLSGGLEYLRAKPCLTYSSWRPVIIGMGIDDLREDSFDIKRADLVQLKLSPSVKYRAWKLTAEISQWLPLAIDRVSDSGGSGASKGSDSSEEKVRRWAGFFFSLVLEFGIQ